MLMNKGSGQGTEPASERDVQVVPAAATAHLTGCQVKCETSLVTESVRLLACCCQQHLPCQMPLTDADHMSTVLLHRL